MGLVNCPKCEHEISDRAETCPHCGYPLQSTTFKVPKSSTEDTQTIEATGKQWKGMMLIGLVMAMGGCAVGAAGDSSAVAGFGLLIVVAGLGLLFVGATGRFWYHG